MFEIYFNEEKNLFRESFRAFLQKEVVPQIDEMERTGFIPREIFKVFGDNGYLGMTYPEVYGGLGLDSFFMVIWLEELQRIGSGGFAAAMWAHVYLNCSHLNEFGTHEQKLKYLVPSLTGEMVGCLCITEPAAGSDVMGILTMTELKGDHYVMNGSKTFITNGFHSDYLVVISNMKDESNPDFNKKYKGDFILDRDTPGITATKLDKLGWRASDTAEIAFEDVKVPLTNLLGEPGKGFYQVMDRFPLERLIMGINGHARAEYALEYTMKYMSERSAFGVKLDQMPVLRDEIADMWTRIEAIKALNYLATQQLEKGVNISKQACASKNLSTEVADQVIYKCLQYLGGYGYMEEYPLARLSRDSRLGPIGGGATEVLKSALAKMLIDGKSYKSINKSHEKPKTFSEAAKVERK